MFFVPTGDTDPPTDTRTRVPSICAAVPALLQRSAVNLVSEGGE